MGYPMTWQRLVNRSRLQGSLQESDLAFNWNVRGFAGLDPMVDFPQAVTSFTYENGLAWFRNQLEAVATRIDDNESRLTMFLADMRRLERDAVDERATCTYIADRTGVDCEVVAAVLKEFFAW